MMTEIKPLRLIHWKPSEAEELAARLTDLGYQVNLDPPAPMQLLRDLRQSPPLVIIIDLSRTPSMGRDIAVAIRQTKATRGIPLIFAGGLPEKVTLIQRLLPDAVYTTWEEIAAALEHAIQPPPTAPIAIESRMAGYAGQPLIKKLGIKTGMNIALLGPPLDFQRTLGELPVGVSFCNQIEPGVGLVIWFVRSQTELENRVEPLAAAIQHLTSPKPPPMWIAWPKKSSSLISDLTQQIIRNTGLAAGLVDYKVCAIDETWSGLLFKWRGKAP
jgi:hypothetical protein